MAPKIIVILGSTASGKSDLATDLAIWLGSRSTSKKLEIAGAEIISADSRQVYKGMDIGTGKVPISYERSESTKSSIPASAGIQMFYRGIPHHLLDVVSPKKQFDIAKYKKLAEKSIEKIKSKNKIPIICGGAGFYIQAIVNNIIFPDVKPNESLRKKLEKKPIEELLSSLKGLDIDRFKSVDHKNKRRIIRAIEIAKALGKVPKIKPSSKYQALQIGVSKSKEGLQKAIEKRLLKRLKQGMVSEVKKLHASGVSWKKLIEFGLEYKYVALHLQGKISRQEMLGQLNIAIRQYSKRQMTWFKHDNRIIWLDPISSDKQKEKEVAKLIMDFLKI